jgi:hypothetical protein
MLPHWFNPYVTLLYSYFTLYSRVTSTLRSRALSGHGEILYNKTLDCLNPGGKIKAVQGGNRTHGQWNIRILRTFLTRAAAIMRWIARYSGGDPTYTPGGTVKNFTVIRPLSANPDPQLELHQSSNNFKKLHMVREHSNCSNSRSFWNWDPKMKWGLPGIVPMNFGYLKWTLGILKFFFENIF